MHLVIYYYTACVLYCALPHVLHTHWPNGHQLAILLKIWWKLQIHNIPGDSKRSEIGCHTIIAAIPINLIGIIFLIILILYTITYIRMVHHILYWLGMIIVCQRYEVTTTLQYDYCYYYYCYNFYYCFCNSSSFIHWQFNITHNTLYNYFFESKYYFVNR